MVLGAAECLYAFAGGSASTVDILRNRCRADETDCGDARIIEQGIDRDLVAMYHVEYAVRQACFFQQISDVDACRRIALGRFEHEGIAAGDRDREHPHRHHHRKVERRNTGAHTKRLPYRVAVDAGTDLLGVFAFEKLRYTAGKLDHLETSNDFTACI